MIRKKKQTTRISMSPSSPTKRPNITKGCLNTLISILIITSSLALAQPIVVEMKQMKINWSHQILRYYGYHTTESSLAFKFLDLERKAMSNALTTARPSFKELYIQFSEENNLNGLGLTAFPKVDFYSYVTYREIISNKNLKIALQAPLKHLFVLPARAFKKTTKHPAKKVANNTGIILKLDRPTEPCATYQISDEKKKILFSYKQITYAAYQQHLMGHWYREPNKKEIEPIVGSEPNTLHLKVLKKGSFQINKKIWQDKLAETRALLSSGKIILSVPHNHS